jgi:glycosyltransferase involved in cell wall biosynthesis
MEEAPLVSIGLPVYNGMPYVAKALDSLLAQTYGNFKLIISDNASTDGTGDLCRNSARWGRMMTFGNRCFWKSA